ncbi:MAG: DUF368 domain-containing protein [Flavobacteriales bacterium]|jgi:putative membrane protein|nr:DUF368 domain-containing protein [Flavobacteriales bacterium]
MAEKSKRRLLGVSLKGMGMGAADVIPGVSGGTIAFITGIYEELLETIASLKFGLLKTWKKEGFKAMWTEMNGSFLLALFAGIAISVASLAVFIEWLLEHHPIQLWSFFFGLIIASVWLVGRTVEKWNFQNILGLLAGTALAYYITIMAPTGESDNHFYIFICGTVAICAMILPGISGSFILLLMGAYSTVLGSITNVLKGLKAGDWDAVISNGLMIAVFLVGCLIGLITFSKALNWLFKKAKNLTIAILTGFLIGSLNKIWPWKETITFFTKHKGEPDEEIVPLVQESVSPFKFEELYGEPHHLVIAICLMLAGFGLIIALDRFGQGKEEKA